MLRLFLSGDVMTDYEGISGHQAYRGDLGLMYFPELDPATGEVTSLKMSPTQLHQMRLCQPSAEDVDGMVEVFNREGRRLGTHVQQEEDGALTLRWQR